MRSIDSLEILQDPTWLRGLGLGERLPAAEGPLPCDRERGLRRRERWRAQAPFSQDGVFGRRLAASGLDDDVLLALLGENPEQLAARTVSRPAWLRELASAYAAPALERPLPWPEAPGDHPIGFLNLVEPLAREGVERLRADLRALGAERAGLASLAGGGDPASLCELFLGNLSDRLRGLLSRTLVLELQVARLEGRLAGDTPEERFLGFVEGLRHPAAALDLLRRYPVLGREMARRVRLWEEASVEIVARLAADGEEIGRRLAGAAGLGPLVEVQGGKSDPHRGGRTVVILRFGSGLRLVYKPKPLAVDAAFQGLLRWLNARGFTPPLPTLGVLDRGSYGWVEHVERRPCTSAAELGRFYRRQGAYLTLLYLLEGTDFHFENLIARGEEPILVDLETLFHARVNVPDLLRPGDHPGSSLYDSVLRIGLLPHRVWGDREHEGVDLSGLGSAAERLTKPFWAPVDVGAERMRFEKRPQRMPAFVENRPDLAGVEVAAHEHSGQIEAGLRDLYGFLMEHRSELSAPNGPLAAFAEVDVRVVFRPTRAYAMLLMESFHPRVLGDDLERTRLLDHLWGGIVERPFLERLIPHEAADLARGDIPAFTGRPASRDLWTASGERLAGFFPDNGLDRAAKRLRELSAEDLERQVWLARSSLAVVALETDPGERPSMVLAERAEPAGAEELLCAARAAGERLAVLAFREGDRATWLSVQPLGPGRWGLLEAPADLYLGLPGIALFLAHLGRLTGEEDDARLARAALAEQRRQLADRPEAVEGIGAFNGWGGLIHALTHLAILWGDEALSVEAESLVPRLRNEIDRDESHDLLAGAAGGLLALLGLHQTRPSQAAWEAAVACGEHLLARAAPTACGAAWVMKAAGPRPLAGLSHGAAGIALALLRLAEASGDERFRRAALAGLAYERSLYSPEKRNWPDLREGATEAAQLHGEGEEHFMCAWCHGAAGVGLARVASLALLDDAEVRREIAAAVETTLEEGFDSNHSLCHGALGNLDFLLQAARALGDAELERRVYRLAGGVLQSIEQDGWLYGLVRGAEPLGLMVGLAGIGHGLLRLAAPERVPSVLALELPATGFELPGGVPQVASDPAVEPGPSTFERRSKR